jgi:hypothetical protein
VALWAASVSVYVPAGVPGAPAEPLLLAPPHAVMHSNAPETQISKTIALLHRALPRSRNPSQSVPHKIAGVLPGQRRLGPGCSSAEVGAVVLTLRVIDWLVVPVGTDDGDAVQVANDGAPVQLNCTVEVRGDPARAAN